MVLPQKEIGRRLREARHAAGYKTVAAVVEAGINIPVATIQNWESGRVAQPLALVARLAEFYRCSVDWIVGLTTDPTGVPAGKFVIDADLVERIESAKTIEDIHPESTIAGVRRAIRFGFLVPKRPVVVSVAEWEDIRERLEEKIIALERNQ